MITRSLAARLKKEISSNKVILLIGARQVGKTTILRKIQKELDLSSQWLNADEPDILTGFSNARTSTELLQLVGSDNELVIIDEAQRIPDIGLKLKLIYDRRPDIQQIVAGSSSFDIQNKFNEPLTGRKKTFFLYPISFSEYMDYTSRIEASRLLDTRILYGSYPEIIMNPGKEEEILLELVNSYLFKDILQLEGVRKSSQLNKLVQSIAFQIGNEVSYNELANMIGNISSETVERYLDLLEKSFIIYKLPGLHRNYRNELKKAKKYYFYDNGVRNAVINNFAPLELRIDKGALWENYLLAERIKTNHYNKYYVHSYFWRTRDQAEIDYVEDKDGYLHAFEFKWKKKKSRFPKSFVETYPKHTTHTIHRENYLSFVLGESEPIDEL